jgi:hypothetical protein
LGHTAGGGRAHRRTFSMPGSDVLQAAVVSMAANAAAGAASTATGGAAVERGEEVLASKRQRTATGFYRVGSMSDLDPPAGKMPFATLSHYLSDSVVRLHIGSLLTCSCSTRQLT